jgi:hypothetical protein
VADGSEPFWNAGALTAGYERLREAVLSGGAGGWRLGHGVLFARGMVGWMSAFGSLAPPTPASSAQGAAADPVPAGTLPSREADEVVAVLAQMTLALAA